MLEKTGQDAKAALGAGVNISRLIRGILLSYILTIPVLLLLAFALTFTNFPEKLLSPVVLVTTIASIFFAGLVSTRNTERKGWLNGSLVGFTYILVLYFLSSIVYRNFALDRYIISMFIIGVLAGSIGGIAGINLESKSYRRYKRLQNK